MTLQKKDNELIWHPYTQMKTAKSAIPIIKGEGAYLFDENGKKFIDAVSSWWVNIHGHSHPYIAEKIYAQLNKLEHVIFAGFTHSPAIELAERLKKHLPINQTKFFYSDDGSTATEVAVKMAIQYWHNKGIVKNKIIAFNNSYHGDTFGAMSISGRSVFTNPFNKFLFDVIYIDIPELSKEKKSFEQLEKAILENDVAAFIFEPLIQGAGGMNMYKPAPLEELIKICKRNNVITIADEVMTGFGRTGKFFATDYLTEKPDLFCLSKGLTGGTMPLGLTTCTQEIYDAFLSDDKAKTLFHGHSFTANPIACSAALASLDLIEKEECWENISRIEKKHKEFFSRLLDNSNVFNVRQRGTIIAFEIITNENTSYLNSLRDFIYEFFIEKGIILRPLGNVLYIIPPYCISNSDLDYIYQSIEEMLEVFKKTIS